MILRVIFVILFMLILGGVGLVMSDQPQTLYINDQTFSFVVADSQEERAQGLSGQNSLPSDEVLVFIFPDSDFHGIWMKDMNFPIDIIWLNEQKQVVDFEGNVLPDTYPEIFLPDAPAKYVVEANAGVTESLNLAVGDTFEF